MEYLLKKAGINHIQRIWNILQQAIERRKKDGSTQWQDGYPNLSVVNQDISKGAGYILTDGDIIVGYCAIFVNDEPSYANIKGKWLTDNDFIAYHRVAISDEYLGQGLAQLMLKHVEQIAIEKRIYSIKADTNFDNLGMLRIFEKLGYIYCGEVSYQGSLRRAFEKTLNTNNTSI